MAQPLGRHLPVDVLSEILARLPVKSLLRFRSVSCSWLSLIDHPDLEKRHLALSKGEGGHDGDDFREKRIIMRDGYGESCVKSCSLRSLYMDPSVEVVSHPDAPPPTRSGLIRIEGSDNGIVCMVDRGDDHVFLWNPSTRQTKKLPPLEKGKGLCFYGFGHASLVDDYKVLCVNDLHHTQKAEVNVYSLRTDSWRQISQETHSFPRPYRRSWMLLNGALHWMSTTGGQPSPIVSFDLCTETFREFPMYDGHEPCGDDDDVLGGKVPMFGVARGCLCVLFGSCYSEKEVWVMKEYGVAESWYHYATISPPSHISVFDPWGKAEIIEIFLEKGEILMQCGPLKFIWYNTRDNTYRDSPLHEGDSVHHKTAAVHVESLVSLA